MKKSLVITCILVLIGWHAYAQKAHRPLPDDGGNTPPISQLGDAFLGEWEWSEGGDVFHISLFRDPAWPILRDPQHRTINVILGDYSYKRNGAVVNQSLPNNSLPRGLFFSSLGTTQMQFRFYDQTNQKSGRVKLEFVAGNRDQITWRLYKVEQTYSGQGSVPPSNFSVPTAVTLTRQ